MASVGEVVRVTINHHVGSVRMAMTLWFRCHTNDLPGFDTRPAAVIANVAGLETPFLTALRAMFHSQVIVDNATEQRYLPNPRQPPVLYTMPGGGVAGTRADAFVPPLNCVVLPIRAGMVGRSNIGRIYISPCDLSFAVPNLWAVGPGTVPSFVNAWAAGVYSRFKVGGTYNWEWGVWSAKFGDTGPRPNMGPYDPAGFRPLIASPSILDLVVHTQRRRQR